MEELHFNAFAFTHKPFAFPQAICATFACSHKNIAFPKVTLYFFHKSISFPLGNFTFSQQSIAFPQATLCLQAKHCILSQKYYVSPKKLFIFLQTYCVPPSNFTYSHKSITLPQETLHSLAKHLHNSAWVLGTAVKAHIISIFPRVLQASANVLQAKATFPGGTQTFCERSQKH